MPYQRHPTFLCTGTSAFEPLEGRQLLAFTPEMGVVISGASAQVVRGVAVDSAGNSYAVGTIDGVTDFDPARRRTMLLDPADGSGFVAKYSAGGKLIWAKSLIATPQELTVDTRDNLLIAGSFAGEVDFDPGAGAFKLTSSDEGHDGFVLKWDGSGTFLSANKFTVGHDTVVTGIGVDAEGYVILSATSEAGTLQASPLHGAEDHDEHHDAGMVAKFNGRLRNVFLNKLAGEEADVDTAGMAIDPTDGGVYVIGTARAGADLDPSEVGVRTLRHATAYLLKLDAQGGYEWHTGYGMSEVLLGAVAADKNGDVVIAGSFFDTLDFNPISRKSFEITPESLDDAFFAKFTSAGALAFARNIGDTGGTAHASAVSILDDEVVIGGNFGGRVDFNLGSGRFRLTSVGSSDGFIARYNTQGVFDDAMQYGNVTGESRPVLSLSRSGLVIGGALAGKPTPAGGAGVVDFDPGEGVLELTPRVNDGADGFVVRYR